MFRGLNEEGLIDRRESGCEIEGEDGRAVLCEMVMGRGLLHVSYIGQDGTAREKASPVWADPCCQGGFPTITVGIGEDAAGCADDGKWARTCSREDIAMHRILAHRLLGNAHQEAQGERVLLPLADSVGKSNLSAEIVAIA